MKRSRKVFAFAVAVGTFIGLSGTGSAVPEIVTVNPGYSGNVTSGSGKVVNITTWEGCSSLCYSIRLNSKSHSSDIRSQQTCVSNGQVVLGPWRSVAGTVSTTPNCGPQGNMSFRLGVEW